MPLETRVDDPRKKKKRMGLFAAYEHCSYSRREQERREFAGMLENDRDAKPPRKTKNWSFEEDEDG